MHFDTPALIVDLDVMEANIRRMQAVADKAKVKLRPHTKTHKSAHVARLQVEAGACGITVAKLGEAEVMADGGLDDILIAYPLVGSPKMERLAALLNRGVTVSCSTDDPGVAKGLSDVGEALGRRIPVYVEVDTGLGRLGRRPGEETVDLVLQIHRLPGIEVIGFLSHAGLAYLGNTNEDVRQAVIRDCADMYQTAQRLRARGVDIREISVGHTAGARFVGEMEGVTEMRPGIYAMNDRFAMRTGAATEAECALSVVATVVSRPAPDRAVIDAGSKTMALDRHPDGLFGLVRGRPELELHMLNEEHGVLRVPPEADLRVGEVLTIIPNHSCPVFNLSDEIIGVRKGKIEQIIPIEGRGKNR